MTAREKICIYRHQRAAILARIAALRNHLVRQTSAAALRSIDLDLRYERDQLVWQRRWLAGPLQLGTA